MELQKLESSQWIQFIYIYHYIYQLKLYSPLNPTDNTQPKENVNDGKKYIYVYKKLFQTEFIMLHKQKHLDAVYKDTYYWCMVVTIGQNL